MKSTRSSISSIQFHLTPKNSVDRQFPFTTWMGLNLFSKASHISFLPHWRPYAGWDYPTPLLLILAPPLLIQQLIRSAVCSGIVHSVWVIENICQSWAVNLLCRKSRFVDLPSFITQKTSGLTSFIRNIANPHKCKQWMLSMFQLT